MIRLGLLRHGHTSWNRAGKIQGRTDIPLDDEARAQLRSLRLPEGWANAIVTASPLSRAQETAALITGHPPQTQEDLKEMDWGAWEGCHGADLYADKTSGYRDIEHWSWSFCPPRGETLNAVRDRVLPWALARRDDTIAVTHIGIMRVLLACATGWNFAGPAPFQIKRNRLYVVSVSAERLRLDSITPLAERAP